MKRTIQVALLSGTLLFSSMAATLAVDTSSPTVSPTPQVSAKSKTIKQVLTRAQRAAIAAARLVFANAKASARDGFDRAIADAQAIRDQAILAAGTDKNAVFAARKAYRTSYKAILNAYRTDLKNAKIVFQNAIAALKLPR